MWGMSFRWWFIDFHEIHTNKQKRRILTLKEIKELKNFLPRINNSGDDEKEG